MEPGRHYEPEHPIWQDDYGIIGIISHLYDAATDWTSYC